MLELKCVHKPSLAVSCTGVACSLNPSQEGLCPKMENRCTFDFQCFKETNTISPKETPDIRYERIEINCDYNNSNICCICDKCGKYYDLTTIRFNKEYKHKELIVMSCINCSGINFHIFRSPK